jgi:hypothetical protein
VCHINIFGSEINIPTPWNRVPLEKHTVSQSNSTPVTEHEVLLPCSDLPASGPYPEPDECVHIPFL